MDEIDIEILPDGTIKSTTGKFRAVNHQAAEAFLKDIEKQTGGKTTRQRRGAAPERAKHTHQQHQHS